MFNQDITKHKLKEGSATRKHDNDEDEAKKQLNRKVQVEITSIVTKRPYLKIMEKIRNKITLLLQSKIGSEYKLDIMAALKDKQIDSSIKNLMKEDKIQILNQQNKPLYKKQISLAADVKEEEIVENSNGIVNVKK